MKWAEQNAKQAILYDFTNPDNWYLLVEIKIINKDDLGIKLILEDLFNILGRDKDLLEQLHDINIIQSGIKLLEAAFRIDPLDPDMWWLKIKNNEKEIEIFRERLKILDIRDPRANILFSRRIERLKEAGFEDLFLELSKHLLSQNSSNFELWIELGKLHERREEFDQAWFCYDQAQTHFPRSKSRDLFKSRMEDKLEGIESKPWSVPKLSQRVDFLKKMEEISNSIIEVKESGLIVQKIGLKEKVELMIGQDRISEAFFMTRRLAAEGDEEALILVEEILELMNDE
jgi:tetratricopeptide (TPR) repeat protein